jgi:hypothetical protein
MEDYCEGFKQKVIEAAFTNPKTNKTVPNASEYLYCWTPLYQSYWETISGVIEICELLGIRQLENKREDLVQFSNCLNSPESINSRSSFECYVDFIKEVFQNVKKEVTDKLNLLDEEEAFRLNEAFNCYVEGCNYSTVAMAVSAIEFRLLNLMQSAKPNPQLENYTLGQLIDEYLQNEAEYNNVIPKRHEHLLNLCNTYRIFSVHPKKEKITRAIATSIVNLTFAFLLDKELKREAKK